MIRRWKIKSNLTGGCPSRSSSGRWNAISSSCSRKRLGRSTNDLTNRPHLLVLPPSPSKNQIVPTSPKLETLSTHPGTHSQSRQLQDLTRRPHLTVIESLPKTDGYTHLIPTSKLAASTPDPQSPNRPSWQTSPLEEMTCTMTHPHGLGFNYSKEVHNCPSHVFAKETPCVVHESLGRMRSMTIKGISRRVCAEARCWIYFMTLVPPRVELRRSSSTFPRGGGAWTQYVHNPTNEGKTEDIRKIRLKRIW